ncbi:GNAT family N-acetyltransferase [Arthrobacter zhaoguopingii]|uniref:GNAT family N-acetyltransferase n=1 Tax=Arthrobacter zhaoguopingii TaxID=2681491 RepID=UPI0013599E75|nr:GNAT family N-acetyltransferase [Arthrobacter zhaoguopingii]
MSTESLEIGPVPVPPDLSPPDAADFLDVVELGNLVQRGVWGSDDFRRDGRQEHAAFQSNPYEERLILAARRGGRIVGRAIIDLPLTDNLSACYLDLSVHPEARSEGVGGALYAEAERHVRSRGRSTVMGWSEVSLTAAGRGAGAPGRGEDLVPATGAGSYPAGDPAARMARRWGFDLAQVDRCSVLDVGGGGDAAGDAFAAAEAAAGPDYEVLRWEGRCPDDRLDQYARLRQAMSTDAPLGDLDLDEEDWDAARVREAENRLERGGGRSLVAAVLHRPTGELAGHTVLERYEAAPAVANQEDTLVLRAHRGHRLGMLLKAANLLALRSAWPGVERIYTWNAEENSFMLAVNVELGFVPAGWVAGWQKRLDPSLR